jgi:integrase
MTTRSKGQVLQRQWKSGRGYAIRFHAYGRRRYLTLGRETEGWTRRRAEDELANVLADVRRSLWAEPEKGGRRRHRKTTPEAVFGPFATRLLKQRCGEVSEATLRYLDWGLSHLLPYFSDWFLQDIDPAAVDAYRAQKVNESTRRRRALESRRPVRDEKGRVLRPLSAASINKSIDVLAWVLSTAEEYGRISSNPARGRRRRLRTEKRIPVYLDSAAQIEALLGAAYQLDRERSSRIRDRRTLIATLVFAGLRAHELAALRWCDVDLEVGRISVRVSKTQAGLREIGVSPILRAYLEARRPLAVPSRETGSSAHVPVPRATRTTSEVGSSRQRPGGQNNCCPHGAVHRYPRDSPHISFATPSPRS